MQFFDLHCDTLYKATTNNSTLNNPTYEVCIDNGKNFDKWRECTAIWIPDNISPDEGKKLFLNSYRILKRDADLFGVNIASESKSDSKYEFLFTVENAGFLNNNISDIHLLKECGVRMVTLTWNAENCIGGGADAQGVGITDFGKKCTGILEKESIVIDVSHACDRLFYDIAENTNKPFAASHSNSRSICNHRRNLTDDQFKIIRDRGGIVGLNFHREFLNPDFEKASVKDVLCHTEHFLSLGGENTVCIGSDFDGSDIPRSLDNIGKIPDLYESFLKIGYTEQLVQKILYDNAYNFFTEF